MLTGACLSRACGFNRRARHATLAMVIAAEIPDADFIYSAHGPLTYFQHHRGWSHTFLWLPFWAAMTLALVWIWHRWKMRGSSKVNTSGPPLRWGFLFGISLIALLSHLLLDWTNNYGVRPFAPFNHHWYQGEIVFIFEPLIFAVLLLALVLSPIFGLADSEVGARRHRAGQSLAMLALLSVLAIWLWRYNEHAKAMPIAERQEMLNDAPILRVGLNPMPVNPYLWDAVIETPSFYQTGTVDTRTGTMTFSSQDIFWKGAETPAVQAAKASWLGRIYLDWSRYPVVDELGVSHAPGTEGLHLVRFRDMRFAYNVLGFHGREKTPLTGAVYVDSQNRVVQLEMNGSPQHR